MMVPVGQTALALDRQIETCGPVALLRRAAVGDLPAQHEAIRHPHLDRFAVGDDLGNKPGNPRLAMMVAAVREQRDGKTWLRAAAPRRESPRHISRVFPRLHPDALLDPVGAD